MFQDAWKFRAELRISGCPTKKPLTSPTNHTALLHEREYVGHNINRTEEHEADKKEILTKKWKNLLKSRGQTYVLILAYLDPKSKKMKILIFGVKIFQHIYPPLNPNAMSFTKSVFPLFLAYQGKDIVFRVIYRV